MASSTKLGRPLKFRSVAELERNIQAFFEECTEKRRIPTISGLAVYLKCDRKTLYNMEGNSDFFPTIKQAKAFIEAEMEQQLLTGKNTVGYIFTLKNNYGWKDEHINQNLNLNTTIEPEEKTRLESLLKPKTVDVTPEVLSPIQHTDVKQ